MTPSRSLSHQAMISRETTFRSVGSASPPAVFDKASASPPPNNLPDIIENTTALEQMHSVGEQGSPLLTWTILYEIAIMAGHEIKGRTGHIIDWEPTRLCTVLTRSQWDWAQY